MKQGRANGSFFGNFVYDHLLRLRPHFLHDLGRAVDFGFVREACRDFYVDWGRDPWDPVLMFKMVFCSSSTTSRTGKSRNNAPGT